MDLDLKKVLAALSREGVMVVSPGAARCLSVGTVAQLLDVSKDWVRDHVNEFPGWFRLPGGGQNGGEIRIPEKAVNAFQERGLSKKL